MTPQMVAKRLPMRGQRIKGFLPKTSERAPAITEKRTIGTEEIHWEFI